jgi:hypothetical protein
MLNFTSKQGNKPAVGCWYGRHPVGEYDVCLLLEAADLDKIDTSIYTNIITRKVSYPLYTADLYVVQFDVTLRDTERGFTDVIEYSENEVSYWSEFDMNNGQSLPDPLIQLFIRCQPGHVHGMEK